jgi:hypothetical protein
MGTLGSSIVHGHQHLLDDNSENELPPSGISSHLFQSLNLNFLLCHTVNVSLC